jgi:hypothetical protein
LLYPLEYVVLDGFLHLLIREDVHEQLRHAHQERVLVQPVHHCEEIREDYGDGEELAENNERVLLQQCIKVDPGISRLVQPHVASIDQCHIICEVLALKAGFGRLGIQALHQAIGQVLPVLLVVGEEFDPAGLRGRVCACLEGRSVQIVTEFMRISRHRKAGEREQHSSE